MKYPLSIQYFIVPVLLVLFTAVQSSGVRVHPNPQRVLGAPRIAIVTAAESSPLDPAPRAGSRVGPGVVNFELLGAKPGDLSLDTCRSNSEVMMQALSALQAYSTFVVPNKTYCVMGGIKASGLRHSVVQIDGTLKFWSPNALMTDLNDWPRNETDGKVDECLEFNDLLNITFTSSGKGTIDGSGANWWGYIKYLLRQENRPRLLRINEAKGLVVERLLLKNSPYWTTFLTDVADVVIRFTDVLVEVGSAPVKHGASQLSAFNTDGFDIAGRNVHIHDCTVWNDDDCVAVKEMSGGRYANRSEDMVIERLSASGAGLTVGSIGPASPPHVVRNITFRHIVMPNTWKGIYIKSRPGPANGTALIHDILYENITMLNPTNWPIWIGPQQAVYAGACSLGWPTVPGQLCPIPAQVTMANITLRDVRVVEPALAAGVVIGNASNPLRNVTFDSVVVQQPGHSPWGPAYACHGVQGATLGATRPAPACFDGGCLADGECMDKGGVPCCSGTGHETAECGDFLRCGCLPAGACSDHGVGCCSGRCHRTVGCELGLGCTCA